MTDKTKVFNIDCLIGMKSTPDKFYELAIIDAPYGIGMDGNDHPKGLSMTTDPRSGRPTIIKRNSYKGKSWDLAPDKCYFFELQRISKNQIIWGANHFGNMPPSSCWIVWDKCNGDTHQSDCELAWTSFDTAVRKYSFMWSGAWQGSPSDGSKMQGNKSLNEKRIHPTQKPVALYKWLLKNYAKEGDKILDTHGGSFSSRIAAFDLGFDFTGYELDKDYFEAAEKRFQQHKAQLKFDFSPGTTELNKEGLFR